MSDTTSSAAPDTGTETSGTPAAQTSNASTSTPASTFGTARGSGLLRGKASRTHQPAAPAAAVPTDYTPTAVSVITPEREYKNPFASETTEPSVDTAAPTPAPAPVAETPVAPAASPAPEASAPAEAPIGEESMPTLDILPPEPVKRSAVSWETSGFPQTPAPAPRAPRREVREPMERPAPAPLNTDPNRIIPEKNIYRPENKRNIPPGEQYREPRAPREPSESRNRPLEQSDRLPVEAPAQKSSGGFLNWLKGLFGGGKSSAGETTTGGGDREQDQHGGRRRNRRRNRGGQGGAGSSGQSYGGPREGQSSGEPSSSREGGEGRRRRGGRNRRRSGGGSYNGEGRSDGPSST